MRLTKIQQTFVRLANKRSSSFQSYKSFKSYRKKFVSKKVKIELIDAVTGQKTTGLSFEDSKIKLKKWLKFKNVRAEFTDVLLKKTSSWFKLNSLEFFDYPVIVKVGTYKVPYIIKYIENRKTVKGKTTCTVKLETVENLNYLAILNEKKELLSEKKTCK